MDTRREIRNLIDRLEFSSGAAARKFLLSLVVAVVVTFLPAYAGLSEAGRWTLFIMIFAAGCWISEAIPAFAVGLVVIALEIAILGQPGGVFAKDDNDWQIFIAPWSSPVIWLFLSGFILGKAAQKTGLDSWFSKRVIGRFGDNPPALLFGVMSITFVFSMFMSNTATAVMMLTVVTPIAKAHGESDTFPKALFLGVAVAANLGGMGTIIGSPPNAIAAGVLESANPISFVGWMGAGAPPAVLLAVMTWLYLLARYPSRSDGIKVSSILDDARSDYAMPLWSRIVVMITFGITLLLWITNTIHGIPVTVVSFIPITVFSVAGIIGPREIREMQWDVLLLLAGGLALGVAVSVTGLAEWLIASLPIGDWSNAAISVVMGYICTALSNFMSNTAAANILVPLAAAAGDGFEFQIVIPIALAASASMCLPISTPPNAIVFSSGRLQTRDFVAIGLPIGILAPVMVSGWCQLAL